jgi:hypothetical protein
VPRRRAQFRSPFPTAAALHRRRAPQLHLRWLRCRRAARRRDLAETAKLNDIDSHLGGTEFAPRSILVVWHCRASERACASDQLRSSRELIFAPSGSLRQESGATVRRKRLKALHEALPDGEADAVAAHRVPAAIWDRRIRSTTALDAVPARGCPSWRTALSANR